MRFAWTGDYAHPSTFLDLFLSGSEMNLPAWSSPEFDRLMSLGAYAEAEAMMLAEYPVIPLYFYVSKHLVSPAVGGFVNNPLDLHPSRFISLQ
jgi:ABC-type oligopeptide transport system substrate-binding subunit